MLKTSGTVGRRHLGKTKKTSEDRWGKQVDQEKTENLKTLMTRGSIMLKKVVTSFTGKTV